MKEFLEIPYKKIGREIARINRLICNEEKAEMIAKATESEMDRRERLFKKEGKIDTRVLKNDGNRIFCDGWSCTVFCNRLSLICINCSDEFFVKDFLNFLKNVRRNLEELKK